MVLLCDRFKLNDEWIRMDSSRLRIPVEKNRSKTPGADIQFIEGERCSARWTDSRKFPATVIKVLENSKYIEKTSYDTAEWRINIRN